MLNIQDVYGEIESVLSMIDHEELPQAYEFLARLLTEAEETGEYKMPLFIANALSNCDKPQKLPDFMIEFVTDLFEYEIEDGNADAMNDLGGMYYDGSRGFEQSFEKAVYYYKMAAENGSRQAQENLGYCYYYGRDMDEPDYEKAFMYFALGAFDGHLVSLYKIGDMYLNGYYVEKNEREAYHIYEHCLDLMTEESSVYAAGPVYLRLGKLYLNGVGTEANFRSALVCFQKAEFFLYKMVEDGAYMYKKSLYSAIEGQAEARERMLDNLDDEEWEFE